MLGTRAAPVAALVCLLAGCGDSHPAHDLRCGPGTHELQLQCVPDSGLSCGPGTHAEGGECRLDTDRVTCGGGTHLASGSCVPDSTLSCGSGTHEADGVCVLDASPLTCGPHTRAEGTVCVPDLACGPGTHEASQVCVPDQTLTCGPGTHAEAQACVPDVAPVRCGTGTHLVDGACLPDSILACGPGTHVADGLCIPDAQPLTCASGTHVDGSRCLPDVTCGPGTHERDGACVPDSTLSCGPGTHVQGSECVPDALPVACGAGTHLLDGACVPDAVLSCGPGTHAEGTECLPDPPMTCGPGTHADGLRCLADLPYFDLRVEATEVLANGYFKYAVLAVGRNPEGTPATDRMRVVSDRPSAGTFEPSEFTLAPGGVPIWFTPCTTASPDCLGPPTRFRLVRASDPGVILASTPAVELVAPEPVGSAEPCLGGGNVFFHDGPFGFEESRGVPVTEGLWTATISPSSQPDYVKIQVVPDPAWPLTGWELELSTRRIEQPLRVQVYDDAYQTWTLPIERGDHPGLTFEGYSHACNDSWGFFEVLALEVDGGELRNFTATFEQWCDMRFPTVGCVHYERPSEAQP